MSEEKNWVERRALMERTLKDNAPALWNKVRAAIQDACESFNEFYGGSKANCQLENGNRLCVTRHIPPKMTTSTVIVAYNGDTHTIEVTRTSSMLIHIKCEERTLKDNAPALWNKDDIGVYLEFQNDRIEPDAISQKILEPVLFPIIKSQ